MGQLPEIDAVNSQVIWTFTELLPRNRMAELSLNSSLHQQQALKVPSAKFPFIWKFTTNLVIAIFNICTQHFSVIFILLLLSLPKICQDKTISILRPEVTQKTLDYITKGSPHSKLIGDSIINSAYHPSEVDQMSTRNCWKLRS